MNAEHPSLSSSLRALPKAAWVLFAGTFLNKFGAFVIPFLTIYMTKNGYSLGEAGLAISSYGVGNLIACVLGGYLSDKIGRRKTIVISMFSAAAAMMLLSVAHTLAGIICLTALAGVTGELYRPAATALLADLIQPSQRVMAYSAYRMAFNAGWAFGPATAGFLAGHGFFWLFAGDAATSAAYGCVAFFALPKNLHHVSDDSCWRDSLKNVARDWAFHRVVVATLAIGLVQFQMASTFGLQVMGLGFSTKIYGLALSLNGALVVLFELPMSTITRRFPPRRVMALGYLALGLGFASIALAHSVMEVALSVVLFTFGEMLAMPMATAHVADLAPAHMRGRYMGIYGLTWALALTMGPALGMKLFAAGPWMLWLACGILGVVAAMVISMGPKARSGLRH